MTPKLNGGEAAIQGAVHRVAMLPLLFDPSADVPRDDHGQTLAWSNNWADWDNSGGHNEWDDHSPGPPGG